MALPCAANLSITSRTNRIMGGNAAARPWFQQRSPIIAASVSTNAATASADTTRRCCYPSRRAAAFFVADAATLSLFLVPSSDVLQVMALTGRLRDTCCDAHLTRPRNACAVLLMRSCRLHAADSDGRWRALTSAHTGPAGSSRPPSRIM